MSDPWLRYLIQQTQDHDGEGCRADTILLEVVTFMFSSLKLTADNEASRAPRRDPEPRPAPSLISISTTQTQCVIPSHLQRYIKLSFYESENSEVSDGTKTMNVLVNTETEIKLFVEYQTFLSFSFQTGGHCYMDLFRIILNWIFGEFVMSILVFFVSDILNSKALIYQIVVRINNNDKTSRHRVRFKWVILI